MDVRRIVRTISTARTPLLKASRVPTAIRLPACPFSSSAVRTSDQRSPPNAGQSSSSTTSQSLNSSPITDAMNILRESSDGVSRYKPFLPTTFGVNSPPPSQMAIQEQLEPPMMGPSAGRSIMVAGDPAAAFNKLAMVLRQNSVKSDSIRQKFHERPGLKRKRLAKERHRRRFKENFKRIVQVVTQMRKMGM